MRFIPTTKGFVNLDYIVAVERRRDGDRWLLLTSTRETFTCDCTQRELEAALGVSPTQQASLINQLGRETALH